MDDELSALPFMLKVDEAALVLRIGRTLAYDLASRFQAGDMTGLPVVRLGGCLRVPRWALIELMRHGRVTSDPKHAVTELINAQLDADESGGSTLRHQGATSTGMQLSLLEQTEPDMVAPSAQASVMRPTRSTPHRRSRYLEAD
jgi:hypothetical protein